MGGTLTANPAAFCRFATGVPNMADEAYLVPNALTQWAIRVWRKHLEAAAEQRDRGEAA